MSLQQTPEWLAAGTDLMERRRSGVATGPVRRVEKTPAMTTVTWHSDGHASIGASVTIAGLANDARIADHYPALALAAAGLATPEIRRMATVGGNLAQRSRCWYYRNPTIDCLKKGGTTCPARDGNHRYGVAFDLGGCVHPHPSTLAAALLVYDATLTTSHRSSAGIAEILGDGRDASRDNTLAADELITSITLPKPQGGERAVYRRAISRAHAEWPLVELVARGVFEAGYMTVVRIAVGGVAAVPLRLTAVEAAMAEALPGSLDLPHLQRLARTGANPLPLTGYKLQLLDGLIADAVGALVV